MNCRSLGGMEVNIILQVSKCTLGNCSMQGIACFFFCFLMLGLVPLDSKSYDIMFAASLAEHSA